MVGTILHNTRNTRFVNVLFGKYDELRNIYHICFFRYYTFKKLSQPPAIIKPSKKIIIPRVKNFKFFICFKNFFYFHVMNPSKSHQPFIFTTRAVYFYVVILQLHVFTLCSLQSSFIWNFIELDTKKFIKN